MLGLRDPQTAIRPEMQEAELFSGIRREEGAGRGWAVIIRLIINNSRDATYATSYY